ncbi:dihydropteroate synthase [Leptospira yanagawae serovar Saopaulo str. Sao Paulo = ATCC 700523]|uniref:Dihydropteroate synthase n=1 Tax=Leptospira yanagawae serovar Saopaulo str. Sao Paulo = ATCC 700523 TaxID=1249483 RepID=A0A5E8HFM9_9LEPT|nr:dihydropteroate synthase [Leptospira yanagawae]EOQ88796.1 dihydropteroate synthase [Leptospira yanagawae serovar Saopaulo str. Sao Paulo = ATCC 700523]
MAEIFGILNITTDSFSDGGKYLNPDNAISKGIELLQEGADWLDISGQSSNIEAKFVTEEEEWNRVEPVIRYFVPKGIRISLDSFRPNVQKKAIEAGVRCLNDITGFTYEGDREFLKSYAKKYPELKFIIMHSHNRNIAKVKSNLSPEKVIKKIQMFFRDRRNELCSFGIKESAIGYDPGMGFFLSEDPMVSFRVLQDIEILKLEFPQLMVSVSRKSFLGNVLGNLPIDEREFATLACELHLLKNKIPYIRTHNVLKLRQAEKIWNLCQDSE